MATSMTAALSRLHQAICAAMFSAIFSPGSVGGRSHSISQDGHGTGQSGRGRARANRSATAAHSERSRTNGTCIQHGTVLSNSADLQRSLENRLRANMDGCGSALYALAWKHVDIPLGEPILQRRALAHRTSDSASSGWPTTMAHDAKGGRSKTQKIKTGTKHGCACLVRSANMAGWPTAAHSDAIRAGTGITANMTGRSLTQMAAMTAGWPTAQGLTKAKPGQSQAGNSDAIRQTMSLCGWTTASARDWKDTAGMNTEATNTLTGQRRIDLLSRQALIAGWPTTLATDADKLDAKPATVRARADQGKHIGMAMMAKLTEPARLTVDGEILTGCSAGMSSGGQLNPAHSRWIMGYPPVWCECVVMVMPSSRKSRPRS